MARAFKPLLVNTVVGFIGPEYLFDGKQITRAGTGRPFLRQARWACRWASTFATPITPRPIRTTADALLALLTAAGVNFVMGVPGADDVMLGYQSTSFHDALAMRDLLQRRPAPEFEAWLNAARAARQGKAVFGRAPCRSHFHALLPAGAA